MRNARVVALAFLSILAALSLSGCGVLGIDKAMGDINRSINGPETDFVSKDITEYTVDQDKVLIQLYLDAGLGQVSPSDNVAWGKVIVAGMNYADKKCDDYLHTLFRLHRDRETITAELGMLGAASSGLMGLYRAAARDVAAVATAFGMAGATVNNLGNNVLFGLEPSAVRNLVKTSQRAYRVQLVPSDYGSRPQAIAAIRGYASICIPVNIESEVNLAVKKSKPTSEGGNGEKGLIPGVTHGSSDQSGTGTSSDKLVKFLYPSDGTSQARLKQLQDYLISKAINVSMADFLTSPSQENARRQALTDLGIS